MHVTDAEIERFRARQLPAEALVAFADHLAACGECRQRTASMTGGAAAARSLDEALGLEGDGHVPELEIHAFVSGTLDEERRRILAAHIESCAMCAAEERDLRAFALAASPSIRWRTWTYGLAAAVLFVGVALGLLLRTPQERRIASLVDVTGEVTVDSKGTVTGAGALAREDRDLVRDTLASGRLSIPAAIAELGGARRPLRGTTDPSTFALISPVATMVLASPPIFRWTPATGATGYVVTLQNEVSGEVTSTTLVDTAWTPDRPLVPGTTYTWQVAATVRGVERIAPAPPAPPARFKVIAAADAERLAALPASHLVRGVAFANAGLLDDAAREFEALAAANAGSSLVERMLQQLDAARR